MAAEGTKYQINFKLNNGTLINIYANTAQELEQGLTDISMNALNIGSTLAELNGGTPAPVDVPAALASLGATPIAQPAQASGGHTCKHGVMSLRSGVGQKGPWSGYMCAAPKGAPDKCDTIWVR